MWGSSKQWLKKMGFILRSDLLRKGNGKRKTKQRQRKQLNQWRYQQMNPLSKSRGPMTKEGSRVQWFRVPP
uniref:Uncharacterized protein n=1 Tax=Picea glauca TaxID=3330 RepID=A0A101LXX7_PICGL|nr:hypothetical protein ABT39_MTgene5584 [Picea glauca]QHR89583.1 hypothetical protein Q903MT_gene3605 [Picea sitchensis]